MFLDLCAGGLAGLISRSDVAPLNYGMQSQRVICQIHR